ncbi:SprB repeat-containing protein [Hymenobacter sp. DH14]|uniref:SprB repeat-containing protein n=1 Tax=Hymenobacter cyanobacteriorum TaxID=2926463 RepID=A0A9X1VD30_9BACT|nr:T9SS type A sorting domain-containing protein [Hymenobacter cyanobacteriorum]MCI1186914.1 SprB repeat-containing protein [Hymenobacter cyanobacteriorum]
MKTFTLLSGRPCWAGTQRSLLRRGTYALLLSFVLLVAAMGSAAAKPGQPGRAWASGMEPTGLFTYLTGARWSPAAAMVVVLSHTDATCAGNDGTITASVTGGVAPYSYLWSNGATTATITGVSAGTYSVTVTDATGATATCNCGSIQVFTPITATPTIVGVQCSGDATGSIVLSGLTGGVAPYTYLWSNGSTAPALKGLTAGTYTVTITDHNGCTSTLSATVPAAISLLATATRINATCAGSATGSIMLAVSGGTAPYSYRWSNGATTQNLSGLAAGTYSVAVTDAGGCTGTATATILEPAALRLSLTNPRPSCFGGASGGVGVAVSGGTAPYGYLWSNGATTATLSGVGGGTYTVTVTDANGCTANGSATITESTQITALASKTDATCYDASNGTVTLAVSGGTAPLAFRWSNGATTQNLSGLAPGTYNVTVTDANGCTATCGATVGRPTQLLASALATGARCAGGTGSVALTASGGTAPLAYLWSNGATTQNLMGVAAGTYSVTVTDANGCTATASASVGEPTQLRATSRVMDATCYDASNGSVDLTVSGGTAPYAYLWSNGATTQDLVALLAGTYTVTITDANGCTTTSGGTVGRPAQVLASALATSARCAGGTGSVALTASGGTAPLAYLWSNGATTQNLSGVAAGTYSVTVTDANGCTATASATVGAPAQLRATASATNATCYDAANGTTTLAVSGGTVPYSYLWSNGATTQNLSGLASGTYSVTVTDASGCTASCSATVGRPVQLLASALATGARCAGGTGSVALTASGGTAPLAYLWSNGATTQNLSGVAAGTYSVTVTDANGCTATASATVGAPAQLRATATATAASCAGGATGSVALAVSGGTAPFSYLWSNGATTQNLTGVAPGTYSVAVTDAGGCTASCSATVGGSTAMRPSIITTAATCCATSSGSVDLTVSGGTAPYSYLWSNGATTQDLSNVAAGTYTVTITDAAGCTATASGTVTQPAALALRTTLTSPSCCNASTGGIDLAVSGGTAPYSYRWSNGATTQDLSGIPAGTYSVTVTDARGCTASTSATLTQPTALRASTSSTNASCGSSDGTATATASGGTAPYSYRWSPGGQTTATATGLGAGTYSVTITDARGCTATSSTSLIAASCRTQHCTLTQGGYGNSNGVICKEPSKRRLELIADMFTTSSLVLGAPGRSLTYSYTGGTSTAADLAREATAQCIIDKMPAGGSAAAFPSTLGNASGCASSFPSGFLRNGRFNNVLVGQTLALALNTRLDNTLAGVPLSASMTSYATVNCSSPDPRDYTGISRSIPASVLGNLDYGTGTPTVGSLLALANKALGGVAYANGGGNPSFSDISCAVASINELFDNCRVFDATPNSGCSARSVATAGPTTAGSSATDLGLTAGDASAEISQLAALPNPFTTATTLSFALPETAKYTLTVYDLKGSEVARVSNGEAQAGVRYSFAVGAGLQEGVYVARLVTATGTQTIRLNLLH